MPCHRNELMFLPILLSLLLPSVLSSDYHHTWAVHLHPSADPTSLATSLHLENLGPIGQIPDHYLFRSPRHSRRSRRSSDDVTDLLTSHPHVQWTEQQRLLSRRKRTTQLTTTASPRVISFNDEYFPKQWYLFQAYQNVTGAWRQGVTGRGVVVSILDDGLEHSHPDLSANYDPAASTDLNDHDDDPAPRYDITNENKHGTRCAGEVASIADNHVCGVGAAYHSRIGGIRMLDGDVTDAVEAAALGFHQEYIDIYSASWGPDDDGKTVDGPGQLMRKSFLLGVKDGRAGRGNIFVWASGNGGVSYDNCNCDGYTNAVWTLSIGSVSETGGKPWYAEECSSTLAVTYSSGSDHEKKILSTDLHSRCTEKHTGTSAAAPMAAGIFALVLQANPLLTWRDMQHLVVRTSKERNLRDAEWVTNGAGFKVSHKFGYGVINAGGLVELAQLWNTVPEVEICKSDAITPRKKVKPGGSESFTITTDGCEGSVRFLEHVQSDLTIGAKRRGDISLTLESPHGTLSQLLTMRKYDSSTHGFKGWAFLSVHHWGEDPKGTWKLTVTNNGGGEVKLESWRLILHGTATLPPLRDEKLVVAEGGKCDVACDQAAGCAGPGPENCTACLHYRQKATGLCVDVCGPGEYLDRKGTSCIGSCDPGEFVNHEGQCDTCEAPCSECSFLATNCTSCADPLFLDPATLACVEVCPEPYLPVSGQCRPCHPDCLTCTGTGYDECTSCQEGLYALEGGCVAECGTGRYPDKEAQECLGCPEGCATCYGGDPDQCLSCTAPLLLAESTCLESCPAGHYPHRQQCRRCYYSCSACTGVSSRQCLACVNGRFLAADGQCLSDCGEGMYGNQTSGGCEGCDPSCSTCHGPAESQCSSCSADHVLAEEGGCVEKCPEGHFFSGDTCEQCGSGCEGCASTTSCLQCSGALLLSGGSCLEACPAGSRPEEGVCVPCDSQGICVACGEDGSCTSCKAGYTLSEGTCNSPCGEGFYLTSNLSCSPCSPGCASCTSSSESDCYSCTDSAISALMDGYGYEGRVWCDPDKPCHEGCELCSKPFNNYCISCPGSQHLSRDEAAGPARATCVDECPTGTYPSSGSGISECVECGAGCASCEEADKCLSCPAGLYLEAGECVGACGESYYPDSGGKCRPCAGECRTCSGPGESCLTCAPGLLHQEGGCVSGCGDGFYLEEGGGSCARCHPTCTSCAGEGQCEACIPGFSLVLGRCESSCAQGLFQSDDDLSLCRPCHVTCENCTREGQQHCLSCKAGHAKNAATGECWPCCSSSLSVPCCYCGEGSPLLCTGDEEEVGLIGRIARAPSLQVCLGLAGLVLIGALLGVVLWKWRQRQKPITYTLLSNMDEAGGLMNGAYDWQEGVIVR